jgi:hypothetical protein
MLTIVFKDFTCLMSAFTGDSKHKIYGQFSVATFLISHRWTGSSADIQQLAGVHLSEDM